MEEFAAITAVVAVIQKLYSTYQSLANLLSGSGPTPDEQILASLQNITQELASLQKAIEALASAVKALLELTELTAFDEITSSVQTTKAIADAAAEELAQWLEGGKTDDLLVATAKNNSMTAANMFRDTETWFLLPEIDPTTNTAVNVFDYRIALVQYVYALTVRLVVIKATEATWPSDPVIRAELGAHADRLTAIVTSIDARITDTSYESALNGSFQYGGTCIDQVSSYQTAHYASPVISGSQADADAAHSALLARQRAEVRDVIGLTAVMAFRDHVRYDADGRPGDVWAPWALAAPTIGPDSTHRSPPAANFSFPVAATASGPTSASLFWIAFNGSIWGRTFDPSTDPSAWPPPFQAVAPGAALFDTAGPGLCAVSSGPGSQTLFWTATDYSIQSTFYDARATTPEWAPPFVVAAAAPGDQNILAGAVSDEPETSVVFWKSRVDGAIRCSSYTLSVTLLVRPHPMEIVVASAPTPPVTAVAGNPPGVVALTSGPGNITLFWMGADGSVQSTYYDQRATSPEWATAFAVSPPGVSAAAIAGVAASSAYVADVFWVTEPEIGFDRSVWTASYGVTTAEVDVAPKGSPLHRFETVVVPMPVDGPVKVADSGAVSEVATAVSAVGTAPIGYLGETPDPIGDGAASTFWLGDDMAVHGTYRASRQSAWIPWAAVGAPIGDAWGPPVALAPREGEVYVFVHVADGTIQGTYHLQGLPRRPVTPDRAAALVAPPSTS